MKPNNGQGLLEQIHEKEMSEPPVASTSKLTLTFVPPPSGKVASSVDRGVLEKLLRGEEVEKEMSGVDVDEETVLSGLLTSKMPANISAGLGLEDDAGSDDPYDRFVRELAFDKRAHPLDKLKTEVEMAQEAAAELENSERARLKRMRGEAMEDTADEDEFDPANGDQRQKGSYHSKSRNAEAKRKRRAPQGDDLDEESDLRASHDGKYGLGQGLGAGIGEALVEKFLDGTADGRDSQQDEDESSEDDEEDAESEAEQEENEMLADLLHNGEEEVELAEDTILPAHESAKPRTTRRSLAKTELPYTFPCPATHDEFLEILDNTGDEQLGSITDRIRILHHPSLAEGNKAKLGIFLTILLDHLLYLSSSTTEPPSFQQAGLLLPHILSLVNSFPTTTANYCVKKLILMQKNLVHGLQSGSLSDTSKTWPGAAELTLLRIIGIIWSTSDFSHPVVAPAMLLMSQYLGQCRIRSLRDLASGLFLCTLTLQYEQLSKRLVPETVNFLAQSLVLLFQSDLDHDLALASGSFPLSDVRREDLGSLRLATDHAASIDVTLPVDLLRALHASSTDEVTKAQFVHLILTLVGNLAASYTHLVAFIELFSPVLAIIKNISRTNLPSAVQVRLITAGFCRCVLTSRYTRQS